MTSYHVEKSKEAARDLVKNLRLLYIRYSIYTDNPFPQIHPSAKMKELCEKYGASITYSEPAPIADCWFYEVVINVNNVEAFFSEFPQGVHYLSLRPLDTIRPNNGPVDFDPAIHVF